MEDYMRGVCDFDIGNIVSILLVETDSTWALNNLTTDKFWVLSYTVGGEARYQWRRKGYSIREGDTMFFQQGFSRSDKSSSKNPWKFIVIKFEIDIKNKYTTSLLDSIPNLFNDQRREMELLFMELENAWRSKMPGYLIRCKSLFSVLCSILCGKPEAPTIPIKKNFRPLSIRSMIIWARIIGSENWREKPE